MSSSLSLSSELVSEVKLLVELEDESDAETSYLKNIFIKYTTRMLTITTEQNK